MKYFTEFQYTVDHSDIETFLDKLRMKDIPKENNEDLAQLFSFLDITSINVQDNAENIGELCDKINMLPESYPSIPSPAAICIYPELVALVKEKLNNPLVNIASVGGGFPSSQTFLQVKLQEIDLALKAGADEIDIVLPVGKFKQGQYKEIYDELIAIKNLIGSLTLKVILETGVLIDLSEIRKASILAMAAGADFIKTSTGKAGKGADPESFVVMCLAIKDFYEKTGKKTGIKAAGGISTIESAFEYMGIVNNILGEQWISQEYFRVGTSKLANVIMKKYLKKDHTFSYFN